MSGYLKKSAVLLLLAVVPSLAFAAESAPVPAAAVIPAQSQQQTPSLPVLPVPVAEKTPAPPAVKSLGPLKEQSRTQYGYVDMAKISKESALGKASAAQAKARQEKLKGQVLAKRKQIERLKANLESRMPSLTPQQREAKAKEFQKKVEDFQRFGMKAEGDLQNFQEGLSKSLYASIEQSAALYGKENGLELVFIRRDVLYSAAGVDARDVTTGIIALMDKKWAKK